MSDKATILYIDDEPLNIMLFSINFKKQFNVITGTSGLEGLDLLKKNPEIKSVISDMKMPGMNGIEFISKAKEFSPNTNYYILTGYDITPEIQSALKTRLIRQYFSKPVNFKEVEKIIVSEL